MRKLFSLFLSALVFFSSGFPVLARGIDKEETLLDGTKLIYVSKEKIPETLEEYRKKCLELINKRYSTGKNLTIKGLSIGAGTLGYYISSMLSKGYPIAALCGQALSTITGTMAFFYPDYRDWKLGEEFCSSYSLDGQHGYNWGEEPGKRKGYGVGAIYTELRLRFSPDLWRTERIDENLFEDIVIVIRPRYKWKDENKTNSHTFKSGVYSQEEMEPNEKDGTPGYRWVLINNAIPQGL